METAEQRRPEEVLRFLLEASDRLGASFDYPTTLQNLAELAVPYLADWCAVDVVDEAGAIHRLAVVHADPARAELAFELRRRFPPDPAVERGVPRVLRTGEPEFIPEVLDDVVVAGTRNAEHLEIVRALGARSYLCVPLEARGRLLGALSFVRGESGRQYDADDLAVAQLLAHRAAIAVDNARLYLQSQAAESYFRALFEAATDGILVVDAAERTLNANPAATRLLGYSLDELRSISLLDLIVGSPEWIEGELARLRSEGQWRGEAEWRRKDGSVVPVEAYWTVVELPTGTVFVGALRDISERRALEREQQEFISIIGHELRNPLTPIIGFAENMQRRHRYSERALEIIVSRARSLERLINDLVDVSTLAAGRLELEPSHVDLIDLTRGVAEQTRASSPDHRVRIEAPAGPLEGWWDRDRLEQVLQNLLSNAVKYSPPGTEVLVKVEDLGRQARVTVRDQGGGIAPDELPLLFERFYRTRAARARAEGLGLGLYISRILVEAHGGRIWAESEPGRGSIFTFTLPYGTPGESQPG